MLTAEGFEVIAYGVGVPDNAAGWSEVVSVLDPEEQVQLLGWDPLATGSRFIGDGANVGNALYQEFNRRLAGLLAERVQGDDLIACHFGHAARPALTDWMLQSHAVEPGIGYPECFSRARIYESIAWWNYHCGKDNIRTEKGRWAAGRNPWLSEWVIPNDFDPADWPLRPTDCRSGYVLYLGRICEIKGMNVIWQMARARPDQEFVLAGQGDATPWLTEPNIRYVGPVHGRERAALMHGARAVVMPTQYLEPFGGVSIEAMMTGTPCLTSNHSVFLETIPEDYRCTTLRDWLEALDRSADCDPVALQAYAVGRWSSAVVGKRYAKVLPTIPGLLREGFGTAEQLLVEAR